MSFESSAIQQRFDASDRRSISPISADLTESDSTQMVQQARPQSEVSWLPSMSVDPEVTADRPSSNLPEPAWRTATASSSQRGLDSLAPPAWSRDAREARTTDQVRLQGTADDAILNNASRGLVGTRENLLRQVDAQFNTPDLRPRHDRFLSDMAKFEQRTRARGLSSQEISNTYEQISRIMSVGSTQADDNRSASTSDTQPLTTEQRLAVASQVMHNAATPSDIRQNQNTCGVTSLETRLYTRTPSAAARLVADVATTGSFTGRDGTTVTLNPESMLPSRVGTDELEQESLTRSLASQLFQVTAANIANRQDTSRGEFQYVQRQPGNKESGEQLLDLSTNPPEVIGDAPGLAGWINGLVGVEQSITGDTNGGSYVYGGQMGRRSSSGSQVESADALGERLQALSESGQLPAVVFVHSDAAMFNPRNDRQPEDLNSDGHYVTVTGYDPESRTVRYDNQYEREADHNEVGVPLEQFFNSTHMVSANERLDRLEARYDFSTSQTASVETELAEDLSSIASTFVQRWQSANEGHYADFESQTDRQRAIDRILTLAQSLPEDHRQAVIASLTPQSAVK